MIHEKIYLALAHSLNLTTGHPQYLNTHQMSVGGKGLNRLLQVGCPPGPSHSLTLWTGFSHDIAKATRPFGAYVGLWGDEYRNQWMPHALYSAVALFWMLGQDVWDKPRKESREHVFDLIDNYWALLYLVAYHHTGFKKSQKEFCVLLRNLARIFVTKTYPELPSLKWVPEKKCPKIGVKYGEFTEATPHWEGPQTILYENLVQETVAWVKHRHMQLPPSIRLLEDNTDNFAAFVAHRTAMGAVAFGDCVDTAEFYGSYWTSGENLTDISACAGKARQKLAKDRLTEKTELAVVDLRNAVFTACASVTPQQDDWLYLLSSTTGSAKTLASVALAGAVGAKQIIFTLPFLALVQQTSKLLSNLGISSNVLEHVSVSSEDMAVVDSGEKGMTAYSNPQDRIRPTLDWEHPLIVTTLERLSRVLTDFGRSDTRRFLRLYNRDTFLILDEADIIPPHKMYVYLNILRKLGCKVLMMTATAATVRATLKGMDQQFVDVTPAGSLPQTRPLRKIRWEQHNHRKGPDLQGYLSEQVLSIYNTKRWAHEQFEPLSHLSHVYLITSNLCPAHRVRLLREISIRLKDENQPPCVVIATPTVESGVDFSFPTVFRMNAPLRSLLQALGRDNREGKLPYGLFVVWSPENFSAKTTKDKIADTPDQVYFNHATWVWNMAKTSSVVNEHDLMEMEDIIARREYLEHCQLFPKADETFRTLNYGRSKGVGSLRTGDYTLIPKDELVSAVVDYNGAHQRLFSGDMRRNEVSLYSVEVKPPPDKGSKQPPTRQPPERMSITFKDDKKPSKVWVDRAPYDSRRGIGI